MFSLYFSPEAGRVPELLTTVALERSVKKTNWTTEQEAEITRIQRTTGVTRKTAIRKMRAAAKVQAKVKAVKTTSLRTVPPTQPQKKFAGVNRAEGIRLFKLAGRPSKEQHRSAR